jgi:hypothetical protein
MLALLALAALFGGWRLSRSAWVALRRVPRCNDDMVFF